jgi:hypothetical protein
LTINLVTKKEIMNKQGEMLGDGTPLDWSPASLSLENANIVGKHVESILE